MFITLGLERITFGSGIFIVSFFLICFQPTFHTIEDIYEVQLDTDRGVKERIRIFDTPAVVSCFTCLF